MQVSSILTDADLNGFPKLREHRAAKTILGPTTIDPATYAEICRLQAKQPSHSVEDKKVVAINTLAHHAYETYDPKGNTQSRKRARTVDIDDSDSSEDDDDSSEDDDDSSEDDDESSEDDDDSSDDDDDSSDDDDNNNNHNVPAGSASAMWKLLQKVDKKLDDMSAKVSTVEMENAIERGRRANHVASTLSRPWQAVRRRAPSDPPLEVIRSINDLCNLNDEQLARHVSQHMGEDRPQEATQAQFDQATRVHMRYTLAQELGVVLSDGDKLLIGGGPGQA